MAILAILALIAIPRFAASTESAKLKAVEANHRTIVSAAQLYYAEKNAWPQDFGALATAGFLNKKDFYKDDNLTQGIPEGASYIVGTESNKFTIKATYGTDPNKKEWKWTPEDGFTRPQ